MKWSDLTKEQREHFDMLVSEHGEPPEGATHFDMADPDTSSWCSDQSHTYWWWSKLNNKWIEYDYENATSAQLVKIPAKPWPCTDLTVNKHNHYYREWHGKLDIYRVIDLWDITDPCFQHALKKIMCAGNRGHKDLKKDVQDIIDTMQRKLEMIEETE